MLTRGDLVNLYRRRARRYDFTANLYYLLGFREWRYCNKAVAALPLCPGDTVVEIGCGTGLNFGLLVDEVGETGRIIGVDMTDAPISSQYLPSAAQPKKGQPFSSTHCTA